jgi:hypothetical protein
MKAYTIKPNSGHPYINIQVNAIHQQAGTPSIMLNVLHNNGVRTALPFYNNEIQEAK